MDSTIDRWFAQLSSGQQLAPMMAVADLFKTSGLPALTLKEIWFMVPRANEDVFDRVQFGQSVRLIAHAQDGRSPLSIALAQQQPANLARFGANGFNDARPAVSSPTSTSPEQIAAAVKLAGFPRGVFDPSGPTVRPQEKSVYEEIFVTLSPQQRPVAGDVIRDFLMSTKLSPNILSQIWHLSDIDGDGALSKIEFCVSLHLVLLKLGGVEIPRKLPEETVASLQPGFVYVDPNASKPKVHSDVVRVLNQFNGPDESPGQGEDPFNSTPRASQLQHATLNRPARARRPPTSSATFADSNRASAADSSFPTGTDTGVAAGFNVDFESAFAGGATYAVQPVTKPASSSSSFDTDFNAAFSSSSSPAPQVGPSLDSAFNVLSAQHAPKTSALPAVASKPTSFESDFSSAFSAPQVPAPASFDTTFDSTFSAAPVQTPQVPPRPAAAVASASSFDSTFNASFSAAPVQTPQVPPRPAAAVASASSFDSTFNASFAPAPAPVLTATVSPTRVPTLARQPSTFDSDFNAAFSGVVAAETSPNLPKRPSPAALASASFVQGSSPVAVGSPLPGRPSTLSPSVSQSQGALENASIEELRITVTRLQLELSQERAARLELQGEIALIKQHLHL